jgi:hypothetical protein
MNLTRIPFPNRLAQYSYQSRATRHYTEEIWRKDLRTLAGYFTMKTRYEHLGGVSRLVRRDAFDHCDLQAQTPARMIQTQTFILLNNGGIKVGERIRH